MKTDANTKIAIRHMPLVTTANPAWSSLVTSNREREYPNGIEASISAAVVVAGKIGRFWEWEKWLNRCKKEESADYASS
jgi:hypothetical protein